MDDKIIKPVAWIGSSYKDFRAFPDPVQDAMGYALYWAQAGDLHASAKPLKGFGGASVIEIVEDHSTDGVVYVLHAFQKKAKTGRKTPAQEIDLVRRRLRVADEDYKRLTKGEGA